MTVNHRLDVVLSPLDIDLIETAIPAIDLLDELSKGLARDQDLREHIGTSGPPIWPHLHRLWLKTAQAHRVVAGDSNTTLRGFCLSLARFTRNLSAGVPFNQEQAFKDEPHIRQLLHHYTSFFVLEDQDCLPVTRMLIQTLSNIVTANLNLAGCLWEVYTSIPTEELVLIRLLGVPDTQTVLYTFVFILNWIRPDTQHATALVKTKNGSKICISLLDQVSQLFEMEESTDGGRAFEVGYAIFRHLIELGLAQDLYRAISVDQEVVTPHQTVLLKLIDSYLDSSRNGLSLLHWSLCDMLVPTFFALSGYTQTSIRVAIGPLDTPSPPSRSASEQPLNNIALPESVETDKAGVTSSPKELDLFLPKICEALVLVTQCLISLTLQLAGESRPDVTSSGSLKEYVSRTTSPDGSGFVESLIGTLRLLDLFLPRIVFGKAAQPPDLVGNTFLPKQPEHDKNDPGSGEKETPTISAPGFTYLKRDLVRLLGILSFESRAVQDRIRECGGVPVVLNLCVIDERNPYLREHAIFALRNLLHNNAENQAQVNELQPVQDRESFSVDQRSSE